MPHCLRSALPLLFAAAALRAADFQGATHLVPIDEETLQYAKAEPDSAISQLQQRIDSGAARLEFDAKFGYLPALLRELRVPFSSQMLVFSKTSLQREHIFPENPRAIFFNDTTYLGWIPGAPLVELSVADPKMGGVFYTLEQKEIERPRFRRTDQCLECHASTKSMGVPGHLVRSFQTDDQGIVDLSTGISQVNDRTPFEERWGGWYVTGTHGAQPHRGNLIGAAAWERHAREPGFAGNETNLARLVPVEKFPGAQSDIVALMVLEHQAHLHNYLTRLRFEGVLALKTYGHVNYLKSVIEGFVKYLLFTEEAPLAAEVRGTSGFAREFEKLGPFDRKGRSLREFDLRTRLFKYPCSYLIYSDAFAALPAPVKEKIYARLRQVLTGADESEDYASLSPGMRRDILEILRDTKNDLLVD